MTAWREARPARRRERWRLAAALLAMLVAGSGAVTARAAAGDGQAPGEAHLAAGRDALSDGLYRVAEKELERYLHEAADREAEPAKASEAVVLLARALHGQGRGDALLKFLDGERRWLRRAAPGTAPFWRALALYELDRPAEALETLAGYEDAFPESAYLGRLLRLRAWCHRALGDGESAVDLFRRFDDRYRGSPESEDNLLDLGQTLLALDRPDAAIDAFERLVEGGSRTLTSASGAYWLGRVLMERGDWRRATNTFTRLAAWEDVSGDLRAEAWLTLGSIHESRTNLPAAVSAIVEGLAVARRAPLVQLLTRRLGNLYLRTGRLDEGVALLKAFVTAAPGDAVAGPTQLRVAGALFEAGRFVESLQEYQYYLEAYTNAAGLAEAHEGQGLALANLERHAEAAMAFEKAYERLPPGERRDASLFRAADAYLANGQYTKAVEAYEQLLRTSPATALRTRARYRIAESKARAGETEAAGALFLTLATEWPDDPLAGDALLRVAALQVAGGQLPAALATYDDTLGRYSNETVVSEALLERGRLRFDMARYDEALADFGRLATVTTNSAMVAEAAFRGALCHYWLGDTNAAATEMQTLLIAYPQSSLAPRALFWLGKQAYNIGDYAAARRHFLGFHERYPADAAAEWALLWAGRAAARQEEYLQAIEILTALVRDYPNGASVPAARLSQGNALRELAKFAEAILVFQEIVNKFPDSAVVPQAWLRGGDSQFMLGAEDAARYDAASVAYRAAADHPRAGMDLVLEAEYKFGRCLQKMDRGEDAVQHYYANVLLRFLNWNEAGRVLSEAARTWVGRAVREAADELAHHQEWRKAASLLERSVGVGLPDEAANRERIRQIRGEYWWLFY